MAVTDYLRGTGTQADPYVVHSPAALKQMLTVDAFSNKYFEVVTDIDCGGDVFSYTSAWNANTDANFKVNLNGHKCFNFKMKNSSSGLYRNAFFSISFGEFNFIYVGSDDYFSSNYSNYSLTDVVFSAGKDIGNSSVNSGRCVRSLSKYKVNGQSNATDFYTMGVVAGCVDVSSAPFSPNSYPALLAAPEKWILDGVSYPRLIPQGRTDLTSAYAIKGVTKIGGVPKKRNIELHIAAYFGNRKIAQSNAKGEFFVNLGDVYDPHIVTHYDEYGYPFESNKSYVLGEVIHPKIPNGYAYDCTSAGVASGTEPTTWPTTGTLTSGSAIFTPRPIYKPESHLVQPVKVNLITGQPV